MTADTAVNRRHFGALALGGGVVGCGLAGLSQTARSQGETPLRMGLPFAASHPMTVALAKALDDIRSESGGAVDIGLFPDSQLGSEFSMQSQLRSGAIAFTATSITSLESLAPAVAVPALAFAFDGYPKLWAALDDGELGRTSRETLGGLGLKAFRVLDNGFRHVVTGTKPVRVPADLQGMKIRVPPSQIMTSLFRRLGASAITVNLAETYAALKSGIAEGMENSLANIEATKVYEVQKHISRTSHSWNGAWILANAALWAKLPAARQALVARHFDAAAIQARQAFVAMEATSVERLKASGIAFVDVDREEFRQVLRRNGYFAEWKTKLGPKTWASLEAATGPLGQ